MRNERGQFIDGHSFTPEMLGKMSDAKKGRVAWNTGMKMSAEHREKLSKARLGKVPWNKGIHTNVNQHLKTGEDKICPICGKLFYLPLNRINRGRKFCSKKCGYKGRQTAATFQKGHPIIGGAHSMPHTEEGKQNIRMGHKLNPRRGDKIWNWKGGLGTIRHQEMSRGDYKEWREKVFKRDNYTCQCCDSRNIYLHADHIIGWSENENARYDVNNGVTLCYRCHYKKTFPNKDFDEIKALKWGVPLKYRKEVCYC